MSMYVAGRDHPLRDAARRFLERARSGEVDICTSIEVLPEILYRCAALKRLDLAGEVYDLFVHLCPTVLPVALADTDRVRALLSSRGITVHAAVMLNHDISEVATFDDGFGAVDDITRVALR